jgi:hypothetical protein
VCKSYTRVVDARLFADLKIVKVLQNNVTVEPLIVAQLEFRSPIEINATSVADIVMNVRKVVVFAR